MHDDEHTLQVPVFSIGSFFADRYQILAVLGSGAMGRVYRARELSSGLEIALKVLHAERVGDAEAMERFRREAEVLASIGHPCIVELYAFHRTAEGIPYLAMELLEGVTLRTRLNNGHFEDPIALQPIVDALTGALSAAHARGVVHRDLKPDNIFLPATGEPRVKLVDFGLSRMAKQDKSITTSGMILGTPRYMPPEQIQDASAAGPVGDLYSLGVIVYECLSGSSPYRALDYGQLLGCLLEGRTVPFSEVRPDLPPAFSDLLTTALAHDPASRFQSADAFAEAYAAAAGRPSQRDKIVASGSRRRPRHSSQGALEVRSRSSTLSFDPAATAQLVEAIEAEARGDVPASESPEFETLTDGLPSTPGAAPPLASPMAPGEMGGPADAYSPTVEVSRGALEESMSRARAAAPHPPAAPHSAAPHSAAWPSTQDSVLPETVIPAGQRVQGGDTVLLPDGVGVAPPPAAGYPGPPSGASQLPSSPPSSSPPLHVAAASSAASPVSSLPPPASGYPAAPTPRFSSRPASETGAPTSGISRGLVIALFLIAMLFVVAISAVGGFALRAYMSAH